MSIRIPVFVLLQFVVFKKGAAAENAGPATTPLMKTLSLGMRDEE